MIVRIKNSFEYEQQVQVDILILQVTVFSNVIQQLSRLQIPARPFQSHIVPAEGGDLQICYNFRIQYFLKLVRGFGKIFLEIVRQPQMIPYIGFKSAGGSPLRPLKQIRFRFIRSEEHTSELQSRGHLVCRLLLEKKKNQAIDTNNTRQDKPKRDCKDT